MHVPLTVYVADFPRVVPVYASRIIGGCVKSIAEILVRTLKDGSQDQPFSSVLSILGDTVVETCDLMAVNTERRKASLLSTIWDILETDARASAGRPLTDLSEALNTCLTLAKRFVPP